MGKVLGIIILIILFWEFKKWYNFNDELMVFLLGDIWDIIIILLVCLNYLVKWLIWVWVIILVSIICLYKYWVGKNMINFCI